MKMNKVILPLVLALLSAPALAGHGYGHHKGRGHAPQDVVVSAEVKQVQPIVEVVRIPQQRRECWDEVVSGSTTHRSTDGMLVGAIIGGMIGHTVGDRHNRGATTAMGTAIGATIGHDSDRTHRRPYSYTERRCSVSTDYIEEEHIRGYRVSYIYLGELYTTRMDHDPGRFVQLRVSQRLLD